VGVILAGLCERPRPVVMPFVESALSARDVDGTQVGELAHKLALSLQAQAERLGKPLAMPSVTEGDPTADAFVVELLVTRTGAPRPSRDPLYATEQTCRVVVSALRLGERVAGAHYELVETVFDE
jgi:hypothetical protein